MLTNSVLVVEDDAGLRPLVQRVLSTHGYLPLCAATASEALELWYQSGKTIRVALLDLTLPGEMSGEELAKKLKLDRPDLGLIITSGFLSPDALLSVLGSPSYLQKPFMPAELLRVVQEAFSKLPP